MSTNVWPSFWSSPLLDHLLSSSPHCLRVPGWPITGHATLGTWNQQQLIGHIYAACHVGPHEGWLQEQSGQTGLWWGRLCSNKRVRRALVPRGGCDWLVSMSVRAGREVEPTRMKTRGSAALPNVEKPSRWGASPTWGEGRMSSISWGPHRPMGLCEAKDVEAAREILGHTSQSSVRTISAYGMLRFLGCTCLCHTYCFM